jgi:hypothetical protein
MQSFLFCFEIAFPYKRVKLKEMRNNRLLSEGLIVSSRRMKILYDLKRKYTLTKQALEYIKNKDIV